VLGHERAQCGGVGLARETVPLADDIRATLRALAPHAAALGSTPALEALSAVVQGEGNDAAWLRRIHTDGGTLPDVVRQQAARWMSEP